jgi:hypothetical protein
MQSPIPFLCFLSENENYNQFCIRYWACDSDGNWLEDLNQIVSDSGINKSNLAQFIRTNSCAYVLNSRCNQCSTPAEISSRSDFTASKRRLLNGQHPNYDGICDACKTAQRAEQKLLEQTKQQKFESKVLAIIRPLESNFPAYDYSVLSYVNAALLYSLLISANDNWQDNHIDGLDFQTASLAPTKELSIEIYRKMYREGIICPSSTSELSAFTLDKDNPNNFSFLLSKVNWVLAPDQSGLPSDRLLEILEEILNYPDTSSVQELWFLVAESECQRYFSEQCDQYSLSSEHLYTEKVVESIRYSLERFSIPQVWNIIWCVIRNIAALMQNRNYSKQHVYNMIPGNIRRDVDKRLANKIPVKPWNRQNHDNESFLTSIIFDKILQGGTAAFEAINGTTIMTFLDNGDSVGST